MAYGLVAADGGLHRVDAALKFRPVVDVDVVEITLGLMLLGIGAKRVVGRILAVPVAQVALHVCPDFALGVHKVAPLVEVDDDVEQAVDALARAAHRGHHGHAQQLAQGQVVQRIAAGLQLVVHVEGHDHAHVHVDELGGEVKVALQVGRVDHVDYDVRRLVDDVAAHVQLLGRVGGEGVRARQVHQPEVVALEVEEALLGIHRDAAVVAHMLVRAAGDVEQRGLPAIGVAHQRHVDGAPFAQGHALQRFVVQGDVLVQSLGRLFLPEQGLGLLFADDFYHLGLLPAEGNLVPHHLIFNRVLQRGVEQHLHRLPLDEAHLHDALAEAAVAQHLDYNAFLACAKFG